MNGKISNEHSVGYYLTGVLLCLVGAVCFSTKAIAVKLAYRDTHIDAIALLALRMIFSLPFFLISAVIVGRKERATPLRTGQWISIAVVGCLGYYVSSLLDFLGLQYISAGIERLVLFIYPTIVVLISSIVFKVNISKMQWAAIVITYAGLAIAFAGEASLRISGDQAFYIGTALILACAFTYAAYIAGSGRIIPVVGAARFNSLAMTFAAIGVLVHYSIVRHESLLHYDWRVYAYSIFMAVISTVIPSYLVAEGIRRIGSDNTAIISSVGPVSTIVQAYLLLGEPISALQMLGTAFILAGVLLISRKPQPQPSAVNAEVDG